MPFVIDTRAVIVCYATCALVCLAVMVALWGQYRRRYRGLGLWLADYVLHFASLALVMGRGSIPEALSVVGGNAATAVGYVLLLKGLRRNAGVSGREWPDWLAAAAFVSVNAWFFAVRPDLNARELALSAVLAFLSLRGVAILSRPEPELRRVGARAAAVLGLFALSSLIRIAINLFAPSPADFFGSPSASAVVLVVYMALFVALTFSLVGMIGNRVLLENGRMIGEKSRAYAILRVRLALREFAPDHAVKELMVKALDEIEELTGSVIGFYHFVDEDAGALSLQAWSTRTAREYCDARPGETHYPIDCAGVWVDCVRERKPVIHNDYAALAHRKGLPAGHAPLVRELVAPTIRDGKIVAILGVGNKATDYTDEDVALVSFIVDLVWTIIAQKRADDRIWELNALLEEQALTDDLTGLANRRAFFSVAERELAKARRYATPLSFCMLDIDRFKLINDTRGHHAGDDALKSVAGLIRGVARDADLPARLGGEEFGILLPNTRLAEAAVFAERLRAVVEGSPCECGGPPIRVTVSIGTAELQPGDADLETLLRAADGAMYRAKELGRNRVATA